MLGCGVELVASSEHPERLGLVVQISRMGSETPIALHYRTRSGLTVSEAKHVCRVAGNGRHAAVVENPRAIGMKLGNPALGLGLWSGEIRFILREQGPDGAALHEPDWLV